MGSKDSDSGTCPKCGDQCDRDEVDIGVGIMTGPWGCYSCGWSSDPQFDRSEGPAPADAEWPDHILDQFGGATPKAGIKAKLLDRFGIDADLDGEGEVAP